MRSSVRVAALTAALLVVVLGGALLSPAAAVEAEGSEAPAEQGPAPDIGEIGTQNEVSNEFLPEPTEPPAFFRFMNIPLVAAGALVGAALLIAYLVWQPRFAEERRSRRRRR